MANAYKLYRICPQCRGTKKVVESDGNDPCHNVEKDCSGCGGTGLVLWGYCTEAIFSIPDVPS